MQPQIVIGTIKTGEGKKEVVIITENLKANNPYVKVGIRSEGRGWCTGVCKIGVDIQEDLGHTPKKGETRKLVFNVNSTDQLAKCMNGHTDKIIEMIKKYLNENE